MTTYDENILIRTYNIVFIVLYISKYFIGYSKVITNTNATCFMQWSGALILSKRAETLR